MSVEILKKLDDANEKLDRLLLWREKIEERCKAHTAQTREIRTVLFENPDLKSQVQTLMNQNRAKSRWKDFYLNTFKIIIATLVVSFIMWLLTIYRILNTM